MSDIKEDAFVNGLGTIYRYSGFMTIKSGIKEIQNKCGGLITLRDLAYARIHLGRKSLISDTPSYVREGSLFIPKSQAKRIWIRNSLVLQNVSAAVNAHSKSLVYYLPEKFKVESYLERIGKDNYLILKKTSNVPTNRFNEDSRTKWAFLDQSQAYGEFLHDLKIKSISIMMCTKNDKRIDRRDGPFADQLILDDLNMIKYDLASSIWGDWNNLNDYFHEILGVDRETAKTYSKYSVMNSLHKVGISSNSSLETMILRQLN